MEPTHREQRRALEQLRCGIFDPGALAVLTVGTARLEAAWESALAADPAHLLVCGAYGQGKSHTLQWMRQHAAREGFVTSAVQLDPRVRPFHHLGHLYRTCVESLRFPSGEPSLTAQVRAWRAEHPEAPWPTALPHRWRCLLDAACRQTLPQTQAHRLPARLRALRPSAAEEVIEQALRGGAGGIFEIKRVLAWREVPDYTAAPLTVREPTTWLDAMGAMARLFAEGMGYRGWIVLMDEVESVLSLRGPQRQRCWTLMERWLAAAPGALIPVMATTTELLTAMETEGAALDPASFARYQLRDLTPDEWIDLGDRLAEAHRAAYGWAPDGGDPGPLRVALLERVRHTHGRETRLRLKALVEELDLAEQASRTTL